MNSRSIISHRFFNLLVAVIAVAMLASIFSHSTRAQQRRGLPPAKDDRREFEPQPQTTLAGTRAAILTTTGSSDRAVVFPDALTPATQTLVSGLPANASPDGADFFGSDSALIADFNRSRIFVVQVSTATLQATIDTSAAPAYNATGTIAVSPLLTAALAMGDTNTTLHIIQAPFNRRFRAHADHSARLDTGFPNAGDSL